MSAARKAIRSALVAGLQGAIPAIGDRVAPNRVLPWQHKQLPALAVYTTREDSEPRAESPRTELRTIDLQVEVVAVATPTAAVDDVLDDLGELVEAVVWADGTFLDGQGARMLERLEFDGAQILIGDEGRELLGVLTLTYRAAYVWEAPTVEQVVDLALAHVEYDLAPPDQSPEAVDDVEIPTT